MENFIFSKFVVPHKTHEVQEGGMFVNLFRFSMCQAPQSPDSYVDSLLSMENTGNAIPGVTPHLRKKNYFTRAHVNTLRKKYFHSLARIFFHKKIRRTFY